MQKSYVEGLAIYFARERQSVCCQLGDGDSNFRHIVLSARTKCRESKLPYATKCCNIVPSDDDAQRALPPVAAIEWCHEQSPYAEAHVS